MSAFCNPSAEMPIALRDVKYDVILLQITLSARDIQRGPSYAWSRMVRKTNQKSILAQRKVEQQDNLVSSVKHGRRQSLHS